MNWESEPLARGEIEAMRGNPDIIARLKKSYKLMLDFVRALHSFEFS